MSVALYRTYRPGRLADVVGQEHVTEPLRRALEGDRVHHAYLFSGPRGCGKTSSARILARSLNCEQGPTPEPCGQCRACVELAPLGPGSMDVIEIDAATHGLVDDARELREKAHFAPVSSRFKVYIIDEAHQLGPGAANALLKIIEEPPPHLKFVFATTAPDKILATIRSRTHHYPFRLIPARTLQRHLGWICEQEGVHIEPAALALVARSGAGSARDALSVLGQLIAGAGPDGVTYELANALLGVTDAALLDEVVDAVAAADGATVLTAVDRALDSGHDPRRFLADLLERFRDLLVMHAVPDAAARGLVDVSGDQAERMAAQAQHFGPSDVVRLAEVVDEGITAMKGTTPTRLQLELVMARLLVPGAEDTVRGVQARLDRIERRIGLGGVPGPDTRPAPPPARPLPAAPTPPARQSAAGPEPTPAPPEASPAPPAGGVSALPGPALPAGPAAAGPGVADARRLWPEVLDAVKDARRFTWTLLSGNAQVAGVEGRVLTLTLASAGARDAFVRSGSEEIVRQALIDVLAVDWRVEAVLGPPGATTPAGALPSPPQSPASRGPSSAGVDSRAGQRSPAAVAWPGAADVSPDDPVAVAGSHADLLARELGATVIEEYDES